MTKDKIKRLAERDNFIALKLKLTVALVPRTSWHSILFPSLTLSDIVVVLVVARPTKVMGPVNGHQWSLQD